MTTLFNKHDITHPHLPDNKFSIGFNVANINSALDSLEVRTKLGVTNLGKLEE